MLSLLNSVILGRKSDKEEDEECETCGDSGDQLQKCAGCKMVCLKGKQLWLWEHKVLPDKAANVDTWLYK